MTRNVSLLLIVGLLMSGGVSSSDETPPYRDPDLPVDQRVEDLLARMTLEEKIAAIIEHKRELMESVVQEDDPHLSKIFSKEELLSMLQQV